MQQELTAAVIPFRIRLGGIRAAVVFEIQFTAPSDRMLDIGI
jgi:hypothetical protein